MQSGYQLSLDFQHGSQSGFRGDFVYLKNSPESGIGKILAVTETGYTVFFEHSEETKQITANSEFLVILSSRPSPVYEKEEKPDSMKLSLMASELKFTHLYDKLSSLSNSRTRLLPHQIESTYIVANSLQPRFILADEVGLGKTIEAALVMKEMIFRRGYKKVLVIAPSPLLIQWQQELKNKFNEDFTVVKRKNFVQSGDNHWRNFKKVITSIDFIKNPKYSDEILKTKWDIVIFDEAHRLRRDYNKITRAYLFAEKISRKTECLLLLTATPFRGKLEELFYLIHLIDPNILGPYQTFINDYVIGNKQDLKEKISKVLLRRRKVEVGGFTKRFAKTVRIELTPIERQFYDEMTDYVKREYNLAMQTSNRAIGFVMIVFQKLLDSSVPALLSALSKRKFMMENKMHFIKKSFPDLDEWDLDETEDVEDFISELGNSAPENLAGIRRELLSINRLIKLGKQIRQDSKSQKLVETIHKLKKEGHKKFLIFTQFRTTQDFIAEMLGQYKVSVFHGSMNADEKEQAIMDFKTDTEILICTEAGGEGRNLQFANVLFNYDLPWSPLKIEQRIGRIHRFGQKDNVLIFNFASKDTVAERILEVLSTKIKLFEDSIGVSDELLGTIQDELDFNSSFMHFVTGSRSREELNSEIDNRIKVAKKGFEKLNSLVTPRLLDFNLNDYFQHSVEERNYNNSHLEKLIFDIQKNSSSDVRLTPLQNEIVKIESRGKTGKGTFNSELALANDSLEFLAFGHPLIEEIVQTLIDSGSGSRKKTIKIPGKSGLIIFVYLVEYVFTLNRKEIIYIQYDPKTETMEEMQRGFELISVAQQAFSGMEDNTSVLERGFIKSHQFLEEMIDARKNRLKDETSQIYQKEEYKIHLSNQKTIRQLEEKLMRQEASFKWESKPERKTSISRTRNEITKAKENFDIQLRKIKNDRNIKHNSTLFQIYITG